MTRPQGDHLVFGPTEDATNLLFQELEMVQPAFYAEDSASVQSELSQEVIDLQKFLDFTSSEPVNHLMDQQFMQPAGRGRNSSMCSNGQPTGSPESGISGCDSADLALSPHLGDPLSPPEYADPVQISMQEANIFNSTTAMNAGLTNLLQLQEELILVEQSVETSDDIASLVAHLQQERCNHYIKESKWSESAPGCALSELR